jgi:hypothetical protein
MLKDKATLANYFFLSFIIVFKNQVSLNIKEKND